MTLTDREIRAIGGALNSLLCRDYNMLDDICGYESGKILKRVNLKIRYMDYCDARGITYEDMDEDDFCNAEEEIWNRNHPYDFYEEEY